MSAKSDQPRFNDSIDSNEIFSSLMRMEDLYQEQAPEYKADSRERDKWLIDFAFKEPHLGGIVSSVTAIDKNRGWSLVGGRNQVNRISEVLHTFRCSPGLHGWRPSLASASMSFWSTDMGALVEMGRDGRSGPIRALYNVDPTKCVLTGSSDYPLKYYPPRGKKNVQKWSEDDFFRVVSLPSVKEEFNGLGNCAVSRSIQLAQLMLAVYRHDEEKLLARAPRGLLLLSGISQKQWKDAMAARDSELDSVGMKYFGSVAVLASASTTAEAKLLALSELPVSFNLKEFTDMILYGYSLCFGYDPSEFYPVQYGALGRGNEVQIQHEKATGKGRLDFVLGFQEQLQQYLPDSIDFAFEQRDDQGDLLHAQVDQAWSTVIKTLYTSVFNGQPLIDNEESRVLLSEYGVIPSTWSPTTEVQSSDIDEVDNDPKVDPSEGESPDKEDEEETTDNPVAASPTAQSLWNLRVSNKRILRDKLLQSRSVYQAAVRFPTEPIVQFNYPSMSTTILWESGESLLAPTKLFSIPRR